MVSDRLLVKAKMFKKEGVKCFYYINDKRIQVQGWLTGYLATPNKINAILPSEDQDGFGQGTYQYTILENTICQCSGKRDLNNIPIFTNDRIEIEFEYDIGDSDFPKDITYAATGVVIFDEKELYF